jgi:hypothetical protein
MRRRRPVLRGGARIGPTLPVKLYQFVEALISRCSMAFPEQMTAIRACLSNVAKLTSP